MTAINLFGSFAHTWFSLMCIQTIRLYINRSKCKTLQFFENIFNGQAQVPNYFAPTTLVLKTWVGLCKKGANYGLQNAGCNPSITDGVHRTENFVEKFQFFQLFQTFSKKKKIYIYKCHFM